jgi:ATP-dependent Clp protease ATP-binding subunit ClpB
MAVESTRDEVMELMKRTLKPEFLNRIDEVVMFTPLTRQQTLQIVDIQLAGVERMLCEVGMTLKVTPAAREWLADAGYDLTYGARPVKRAIQTRLVNALSRSILAGSVERDRPIEVEVADGQLVMKNA